MASGKISAELDVKPRPLKADELTPCVRCKRGLLEEGGLVFYRVSIRPAVVDAHAVQERRGLQMLWHDVPGSYGLAEVFAPSLAVAHEAPAPTMNVCLPCLTTASLADLWEAADDMADGGGA